MNEKNFEDILCRYPELIEEGLIFHGRQVNVKSKYVDLIFNDRHGQKVIIELKIGTIVRNHIAQLLDYEGYFLSADDPTGRVMIIGNRVPENLRRSLIHHGFEWREMPLSQLRVFLKSKNDMEYLEYASDNPGKTSKGKEVKTDKLKETNIIGIPKMKHGFIEGNIMTVNDFDNKAKLVKEFRKRIKTV